MQELTIVHYLPILSAFVVFRRYQARGGTHLLWWSVGILVYGLGTFAEGWMTRFGWNPGMFKFWYIVGALMGGAPLAQGTVWLLLKERTARTLSWILAAVIGVAAVAAMLSPINYAVVDAHVPSGTAFGWQWVRMFSPFINLYAVIFLVGGAIYSAWRFGKVARAEGSGAAIARDRFFGNVFIAVGAILPGIGGVATRLGHTEILYMGELAGIILIWIGYWFNIRRRPATRTAAVPVAAVVTILAVALVAPGIEAQENTVPRVAWVTGSYGDRTDVPTGVDPTDGYVLHDLHASWSPRFLRDVTLYASVNNLTNTRYEDPRFGTPGIARDVRLGFGLSF